MLVVSAADVRNLREKTGAGMMDCKKALVEADGDFEKAVDILREKGLAKAAKKAGRVASEGLVVSYIQGNGKIGVLLEVNCETDFVARNEEFASLCHDIAMQVAAANPEYVSRDEIPQEVLEREKSVLKAQALNEGKPEHIVEKMVEGRMEKYFQEVCLLDQPFIKDQDVNVQHVVKDAIAKLGENITVRRFARFVLGEGIEKEESNLAQEVADMAKK
ncbi:MAG TPA: translation elongation factor Ts [Clostridia bacterium]|nr:translation elongation factor Ts [Clostridia bacterium]